MDAFESSFDQIEGNHEMGLISNKEYNADVIERLLSHQEKNKVRDSYNRAEYLPQRKKFLQWLGDYIDSIDIIRDKEDTIITSN